MELADQVRESAWPHADFDRVGTDDDTLNGNFYQISTAESRLRMLKQDLVEQGKEFGKIAGQNLRR